MTAELLIPAVHAVVDPVVQAARRRHGPLPSLRSAAFLSAPYAARVAALLVLGEAWVLGDGLIDEVSTADYAGGKYHRPHLFPAITEAHRRRYPPTGDRDVWIRYGPAGPPAELHSVEPASAALRRTA